MAIEPAEATRAARAAEARGRSRAARSSQDYDSGEVPARVPPGALASVDTQSTALAVIVLVVVIAFVSWAAAAVIAAIYVLLCLALRQMRRTAER